MSDSEADSYLEEWKFAEKVRARRNVPGGHPFSLRFGTKTARHAVGVYSRIIKIPDYVKDTPLLATLSEQVILYDIERAVTKSSSADSTDDKIFDLSEFAYEDK